MNCHVCNNILYIDDRAYCFNCAKRIWGTAEKALTKILMDEEKITITIENKPFTYK